MTPIKLVCAISLTFIAGCNSGAEVKLALSSACTIRKAASIQQAEHPEGKCPTMALLVGSRAIESEKPDPWGKPYEIDCSNDVIVKSAGPDMKASTADDVVADTKSCAPFASAR